MGLNDLKRKIAEQKAPSGKKRRLPEGTGVGETQRHTPTKLKSQAPSEMVLPKITKEHRKAMDVAVTTEAMTEALPMGYTALGKHDLPKLLKLKADIQNAKILSFDYETDGDPEDDTTDPQDHTVVGVSVAFQIGQAIYLPMGHIAYGANWDQEWLVLNFLKPLLEHPDILIIAHNVKAEHAWSLCMGIDFSPKAKLRKIIDTMVMVKQLQLTENIGPTGDVAEGLKPATKALLADSKGMVHGLIHVDDIKDFKETVGKYAIPIPGEFYKVGAKKGQSKTKLVHRTFNMLPLDQHTIDYACSDSDWALGLYHKLMPILEAEGLTEVFFELNVPFMLCLAEYELAGWHVNKERLEDMRAVAERALYGEHGTEKNPEVGSIMHTLNEELRNITRGKADVDPYGNVIVPAGVYGMGEWRNMPVSLEIKTTKPFSWGSVDHKQWLFFHILKIDTRGLERSKSTGIPGTGKENWKSLVDGYTGDNKFMEVLKEKSKYDKLVSTYVNGMVPFSRKDTGKMHTNLRLVSTWRLASKKPNLQNIPRADNDLMGIRSAFVAPDYDPKADYSHLNICTRPTILLSKEALRGTMMYVNADYSQIELRVLAWYANEMNMIQAFWAGHDFHSATAHDVFNLNCTIEQVKDLFKSRRYQAKAINFGLVYGLTEYGLSKDPKMQMTTAQAKQFIDRYFMKYPGVKLYAEDQIAFAREHGYVETIFGNRRAIPDINNSNKWIRQSAENKAMNTPIQGSASDVIRKAMVDLQWEVKKPENRFLKPVMQIHDELQGEAPVEYALEAVMLMKEVMERPIEGLSEVIPIVADPAIGKTWQHALDVKFDENGKAYVAPRRVKKEATDVTIDEIEYALELYHIAGIDVRPK